MFWGRNEGKGLQKYGRKMSEQVSWEEENSSLVVARRRPNKLAKYMCEGNLIEPTQTTLKIEKKKYWGGIT